MVKTIVELDLVGYSDIARTLEENMGPDAVADLNRRVQQFVDRGLSAAGAARADTVMTTTGDGAILVFPAAEQAHRFAKAVHDATAEHNATRTHPSARRRFRIGTATGDIDMRPRPGGGFDIAGITIANAVRLEAAARPGELLIDVPTYDALSDDLRRLYGPEEQVTGKRDETFRARRCVMTQTVPGESDRTPPAPPEPRQVAGNRQEILRMLGRLYPEDLLDKLIFLLAMPIEHRPSRTLNHADRGMRVLEWAESRAGPGLKELESALRYLMEKESIAPPPPALTAPGPSTQATPPRSTGPSSSGGPTAPRITGSIKTYVCDRLVYEWEKLADHFRIPISDRAAFPPGRQPHRVWEWLELRGRLEELPGALEEIGQSELAQAFRANPPKTR